MTIPNQGNVLLTFVTPVLVRRWPDAADLNRRLREVILAAESRDPGMARSNVGGWHSNDDFFSWEDPAIGELRARVAEGTREITLHICGEGLKGRDAEVAISGWANVSRDRAYNRPHDHLRYTWSGVYYVTLGEQEPELENNGAIEFLDPRLGVDFSNLPGAMVGPFLRVQPEACMMLMFPSWLRHWVHPFHGRGERISIAFNVNLRF
ncbi:MAG: hypothetical protein FJX55_12155 [Alphaproteobacteria bacterium]|nr:hypothetical protein [Alphaproteobacteria bacterium]